MLGLKEKHRSEPSRSGREQMRQGNLARENANKIPGSAIHLENEHLIEDGGGGLARVALHHLFARQQERTMSSD